MLAIVTLGLVAVAIAIGAVTGGYHYVMDVATGAAVGALSALVAITVFAEPGTGSGYQAAILGSLAREVYTIESIQRFESA